MLINGVHPPAALMIGGVPLRILLTGAAGLAALAASPACSAQVDDFPNKPIRIVHGFAVGGDAVTRIVAAKLVESLKQQVVVDNRPSAGGILAGQMVAHLRSYLPENDIRNVGNRDLGLVNKQDYGIANF